MTYDEAKLITYLVHEQAVKEVGHDAASVALEMAVAALSDASVMTALFITAKVQPPTRRPVLRSIPKRQTA